VRFNTSNRDPEPMHSSWRQVLPQSTVGFLLKPVLSALLAHLSALLGC
jgi:hypothetical protein